jgi:hypothetical protein
VPYYEYVYQRKAYTHPNDSNNLFSAMFMVYALIKAKLRGGIYGNTDFKQASDAIFRGIGVEPADYRRGNELPIY